MTDQAPAPESDAKTASIPIDVDIRYDVKADVVREAVTNGVAATLPHTVGEFGRAFVKPLGFEIETIDVRDFEPDRLPETADVDGGPLG